MDAILVFARAPRRGRVKTRLAADLGEDAALAVYRACLAWTLAAVRGVDRVARRLYVADPADVAALVEIAGDGFTVHPQAAGDLGARMATAFRETRQAGHERALVIATDTPDLDEALLVRARHALDRHPTVIGPSMDGGYYLLGMRLGPGARPLPDLFDGMPWSTPEVLPETLRRLERAGVEAASLHPLRDLDTAADLRDWLATAGDHPVAREARRWRIRPEAAQDPADGA
jgi:uncharacterized protein